MPKKKRPDEKPEDQFKRFVEAAKKAEIEPDDADRVFRRLADQPPKKTAERR